MTAVLIKLFTPEKEMEGLFWTKNSKRKKIRSGTST